MSCPSTQAPACMGSNESRTTDLYTQSIIKNIHKRPTLAVPQGAGPEGHSAIIVLHESSDNAMKQTWSVCSMWLGGERK